MTRSPEFYQCTTFAVQALIPNAFGIIHCQHLENNAGLTHSDWEEFEGGLEASLRPLQYAWFPIVTDALTFSDSKFEPIVDPLLEDDVTSDDFRKEVCQLFVDNSCVFADPADQAAPADPA